MIGVMSQGRIEQWDTAYNLYHRPATRHVADFIGEGVFLPGTQMDSVTMEHSHVQTELGFITRPTPARTGTWGRGRWMSCCGLTMWSMTIPRRSRER